MGRALAELFIIGKRLAVRVRHSLHKQTVTDYYILVITLLFLHPHCEMRVFFGACRVCARLFRKVHFEGVSDLFHDSHLALGWLFNLIKQ